MSQPSKTDHIYIESLTVDCIIGVFDWERTTPQTVKIDLELPADGRRAASSDHIKDTLDYKKVSKSVVSFVESSHFFLLETLAEKIAELLLSQFSLPEVGVSVSKPKALRDSENVKFAIRRSRADLESAQAHYAYLNVGSNIRPEYHIHTAIRSLRKFFVVAAVSKIYQSSAYGMGPATDFWNVAVKIRTVLSEKELKERLCQIEEVLGRVRAQGDRYASRTIDIDIVFYDGNFVLSRRESGESNFKVVTEQGFLWVPLTEMAPDLIEPTSGKTLFALLAARAYADQSICCLGDSGEVEIQKKE